MSKKLSMDELNRLDVSTYKSTEKFPYVIVLDDIRSMNNIGSAFRTGDAFKCAAIHLCGITAQPPHREISKTALGADESVDWVYFEDGASSRQALRAAPTGVWRPTASWRTSNGTPHEDPSRHHRQRPGWAVAV